MKKSDYTVEMISPDGHSSGPIAGDVFEKRLQKIAEGGANAISEPNLNPLHLACSTDDLRPEMQLIKIRRNIATASNGILLVKINLAEASKIDAETLKTLDGKNIHREVWKEIHNSDTILFYQDQIDCHKSGIKKTFYYSEASEQLWDDKDIIQNIRDAGEEEKRIVCYNPALITIIGKIFKSTTMYFSFSSGKKGTVVFPEVAGMFAILMPIEAEGVNRYFFE